MPTITDGLQPETTQRPDAGAREQTRRLHGLSSFVRDPFALLDHRTQRRLIARSAAAPGAYLALESADGTWLFALTEPAMHVGRGLTADLRVDDAHVSRRHATFTQDGRGTHVLDGRSLNGTWVNGERVAASVLHSGDLIELGPLTVRYLEID